MIYYLVLTTVLWVIVAVIAKANGNFFMKEVSGCGGRHVY